MINPKFHIETEASQQALTQQLEKHQPWRVGISFSNGVNTADLETTEPFSSIPLNKLRLIADHYGENNLINKRVLDIGSNVGYNAIILSRDFGCNVTGIDNNLRNIKKATMIAKICGVNIDFKQADAGSYYQSNEFDVILHLGTLYHLPDPVGALKCATMSLKSKGRIYIESAVYEGQDDYACRFIHGYNNDYTNYWALSPKAIVEILQQHGLTNIEKIHTVAIKTYEGTGMSRALFCAEKV
jgi:tRNA (mo5U34)-methyltransferase